MRDECTIQKEIDDLHNELNVIQKCYQHDVNVLNNAIEKLRKEQDEVKHPKIVPAIRTAMTMMNGLRIIVRTNKNVYAYDGRCICTNNWRIEDDPYQISTCYHDVTVIEQGDFKE